MIRVVFLSLCLCFLAGIVSAQDNLTGRIYEFKTKTILPGVTIRNLRTNGAAVSDRTGAFSITAKVGDLVVFNSFAYQPDTLYVKDLKYTEIQLVLKSNMLSEVKVTGQEVKVGNLKPAPLLSPFGSQAIVYTTDDKGTMDGKGTNYTGGVRINVFDSRGAEKKREHAIQTEKDEAVKAKIADIFSPTGLKDYVPFKGQEMQNFITMYTPSIDVFTAPDFNLTVYINESYHEFMKIPADERQSADLTSLKGKGN
ncbi:MAG TPA: hypothetical protein VG367_10225 [Mucilaginibacter sp.]|jgi:hypothetical protein|nr:hypothetical protein [Mucilaginibacter sp.]